MGSNYTCAHFCRRNYCDNCHCEDNAENIIRGGINILKFLIIALLVWLVLSEGEKPREDKKKETEKTPPRKSTISSRPSGPCSYPADCTGYDDTYVDQLGYEEDIADQAWDCEDFSNIDGGGWQIRLNSGAEVKCLMAKILPDFRNNYDL